MKKGHCGMKVGLVFFVRNIIMSGEIFTEGDEYWKRDAVVVAK